MALTGAVILEYSGVISAGGRSLAGASYNQKKRTRVDFRWPWRSVTLPMM